MKYADALIKRQAFEQGETIRIQLESGSGSTKAESIRVPLLLGERFTSAQERDAILEANRQGASAGEGGDAPAPDPGPEPTPAGPYFSWVEQASSPTIRYQRLTTTSDFTTQITTRLSSFSGAQGPYISTDSGASWTLKVTGMTFLTSGASYTVDVTIARSNPLIMYAANRREFVSSVSSTFDKIWKSTDGGNSWTAVSPADSTWQSITCSADGSIVLAGNSNSGGAYDTRFAVSINGGSTWTAGSISGQWTDAAMSSDGSRMYLRSVNISSLYRSSDTGSTWTFTTTISEVRSIACSADGLSVIIGTASKPMISKDGGVTLTTISSLPTAFWDGVAISDDGKTMAAVNISSSYIYISIDSGASWSQETGAPSTFWQSVALNSDGTRIVAGGSSTKAWVGTR
jgi:hypothetical protein